MPSPKRQSRPTPLNRRAIAYMAEKMAMAKTSEDQGENWLLGHMVTFAAGERSEMVAKLRAHIDEKVAAVSKANVCVMPPRDKKGFKAGAVWALRSLRNELARVTR